MDCCRTDPLLRRRELAHSHYTVPRISSFAFDSFESSIAGMFMPYDSDADVHSYSSNPRFWNPRTDMSESENTGKDIAPVEYGSNKEVVEPESSLRQGPSASLYHQHHESTSTSASDSTDSSPTTTVSTVDDSSATEMSPGSSPESPMAKPPPSNFAIGHLRPHTAGEGATQPISSTFFELQRPNTPGKKARNLKNLAVNTSGTPGLGRAASTTSLPFAASNNPPPSTDTLNTFAKPPSPPRRKPSNLGLTIMTPGNSAMHQPVKLAIPPTPSFAKPNMLRHFQSSPSLPLYNSSQNIFGRSSNLGPSNTPSPDSSTPGEIEDDQNFDIPQSREEKPEAYPEGPICVYDPHIDLYLEPTAEQALEYDVILNVASEVRNPFDTAAIPAPPEPGIRLDGGGGIQYAPKRRTSLRPTDAVRHESMLSAVPESSPTTPKATPLRDNFFPNDTSSSKEGRPEYIHIPWEHNTDIVPDLLRLVKIIDDRVQQGKRVLVHCQCGVSRSATLVVAYGLYKDPTSSVQEAYDAVKQRSKWIGPNMNLIMQLQEFRSTLTRPGIANNMFGGTRHLSPILSSPPYAEWARPAQSPLTPAEPSEPKTAPLPAENASPADAISIDDSLAMSPGPSSAPSGVPWPLSEELSTPKDESRTTHKEGAAYVDPAGHVVPVVRIIEAGSGPQPRRISPVRPRPRSLILTSSRSVEPDESSSPLVSPRSAEFGVTPLQPSPRVKSEDVFGLMSPQVTEFSHSPLDRDALLGALGMGSTFHSNHQQTPKSNRHSMTEHPLRPKLSGPSISETRRLHEV